MHYAIGYARDGYPVVPGVSAAIGVDGGRCSREHWPSSAEVYLPGGRRPPPGARFANPVLAATYQRMLDEAEAAGRGREIQIEAAPAGLLRGLRGRGDRPLPGHAEVMDATGDRHRGLLTAADLAALAGPHGGAGQRSTTAGLTVCKTGPWGQGPVFLQQLRAAGRARPRRDGPGQRGATSTRSSSAPSWLSPTGRPGTATRGTTDVPLADLLSAAVRRAAPRAGRRQAASGEPAPRRQPGGAGTRCRLLPDGASRPRRAAPGRRADRGAGRRVSAHRARRRGDTCHLDVADRFGNLVVGDPQRRLAAELAGRSPASASASAPGRRCSASTPGLANTLAPGKRPAHHAVADAWPCATASPTWRSAPPAATSRTSGRCRSS